MLTITQMKILKVHLRYAIAQIFQQYQQLMTQTNPIDGKFGTDSDAQSHRRLFSPKDENSYERILKFRRTIYQNPV